MRRGRRVASYAAGAAALLCAVVLAAAVMEGLCRVVPCAGKAALTLWRISFRRNIHIRRDELLGWGNMPNVVIPNMYGPGVYLRTNSQGLRADQDFAPRPPPGKIRVVCSGESTTMGYGVANGSGWCESLNSLDRRIEPVNMGQIHYGLDQMYLWYLRDGVALNADIHIVALLNIDISRMGYESIFGMPKPVLELRDGQLRLGARAIPWWRRAASSLFPISRVSPRISPWSPFGPQVVAPLSPILNSRLQLFKDRGGGRGFPVGRRDLRGVAVRVFETLDRIDRKRGAAFVVVWLPWITQRARDPDRQEIAEFSKELNRKGIVSLDLVEEFSRWPIDKQDRLLLPADAHYSKEGNRLVAEMVYQRLRASRRAGAILSAAGRSRERRP